MQKKWFYRQKRCNYDLAKDFGVHPAIIKILADRGVETNEDVEKYLYPDMSQVTNGMDLTDMQRGVDIIFEALESRKKIRIMADYDVDGVTSGYILWKGLKDLGADADIFIPHRVINGYGLHEDAIRKAAEDGIQVILTCDNGIAAAKEILLAKQLGMTTVVTDHHEVPYEEVEDGKRKYMIPPADAVIDPKRPEDNVFKEICGAVVSWKFMGNLYRVTAEKYNDLSLMERFRDSDFLEMASLATVCDVMELQNENRAIVKEGLKRMPNTSNIGMQALLNALGLIGKELKSYDYGFRIGPCINAEGRLEAAMEAFELLRETDPSKAAERAEYMVKLNAERQELTKKGMEEAFKIVDEGKAGDKVLVVYLPECHESIAGIIAGKVRERYNRPAFVLTKSKDFLKGSGRSIEKYSMYEELVKCKELLLAFGGHPMAAGLSLKMKNLDAFRTLVNRNCPLEDKDFIPKLTIDVILPVEFLTKEFVKELNLLEPFGKGNEKPVFVQKNVRATNAEIIGKNHNVLKVSLANHGCRSAISFHDVEEMEKMLKNKLYDFNMVYYPDLNEWQGRTSIQAIISDIC